MVHARLRGDLAQPLTAGSEESAQEPATLELRHPAAASDLSDPTDQSDQSDETRRPASRFSLGSPIPAGYTAARYAKKRQRTLRGFDRPVTSA